MKDSGKAFRIYVYLAAIVIFAAALVFMYLNRDKIGKVLTPFLIAVIIIYLVSPAVRFLERRKLRRWLAILAVYLVFISALTVTLVFLVPEIARNITELLETLPGIVSDYEVLLNERLHQMQKSRWPEDIKNGIFNEIWGAIAAVSKFATDILGKALKGLVGTVGTIFHIILGFVIAFYLMKDRESLMDGLASLVPRKFRKSAEDALHDISGIISKFIQGQLLTSLILGVLETAGLLIVGVRYALILGLIGGIANFVPYFGPYIGAIPAVIIAFLDSPSKALWTVVVFVIAQEIDNDFVSPKIIKDKLGLHPVTTILAVLAGGQFFGLPGLIFSVPAVAILKVLLKRTVNAIV